MGLSCLQVQTGHGSACGVCSEAVAGDTDLPGGGESSKRILALPWLVEGRSGCGEPRQRGLRG